MEGYLNPEALQEGHKFSKSGIYYQPAAFSQTDYLEYIQELPLIPSPEAFGMHDNADISNAQNETISLLSNILSLEPKTGSTTGKSREDIIADIAHGIHKQVPPAYNEHDIMSKFPVSYEESMNTVLFQEVVKYNKLLNIMNASLVDINKALAGKIVMSDDLE